jgi:hypothetical protein
MVLPACSNPNHKLALNLELAQLGILKSFNRACPFALQIAPLDLIRASDIDK